MSSYYSGKRVLVTGGTGLIGRPLVDQLVQLGANVTVASLDQGQGLDRSVSFKRVDLRELTSCIDCCKGQQIVFHLAGVKGSPKMTAEKPASFLVPTVQFSFNMMEAARRCNVERFLFTSSVGVYAPAPTFYEDSVWDTFPSENDKFAGWAKRICELQAEAFNIEHGWNACSIVRPANVYGPHDNFDIENAMVIPSLIRRAIDCDGKLVVWGDGSAVRDFIYASDVAAGMLTMIENNIQEPVNLGSGSGISIKELAETIVSSIPGKAIDLVWDKSKPSGDAVRIMDTTRAQKYGINPSTSLADGITTTINWFMRNKNNDQSRYNSFTEDLTIGT